MINNNSAPSGKKAIIIGAGPAGLTAALELLERTDIKPVVFEMSDDIGGISKTVNYKGNRIDIGGHRFFSKSEKVMEWWDAILPKDNVDPDAQDKVMLTRNRLSRIYYLRKFFSYPVTLSVETLKNLGLVRVLKIGISYVKIRFFPIKNEKSLEDFFVNRFGRELYLTFFKDYTEKLWGVECSKISADWGAQRVKGLSVSRAIIHGLKSIFQKQKDQKKVETSLIDKFYYPKFGPGQMWEEVAKRIKEKGGEVRLGRRVVSLTREGERIVGVKTRDEKTGLIEKTAGDYFISTMPVRGLVRAIGDAVPAEVKEMAEGLVYRDFVTVGLLLRELKIKNTTKIKTLNDLIPDNWMYIQERDVKLGRVQVFNNWSPYMVVDKNTVWIGLEYFCNQGDSFWNKTDEELGRIGTEELSRIGIIREEDVLDKVIIKMPKAYPAYFGTYDQFDKIRNYTDGIENLFLIGRNGMHRYNNMDHSMLAAMAAVDNIIGGIKTKDNIWQVNAEKDYHEEKGK